NNSGFMITAYTAQSVLSEIKASLYPRSSFSMTVANGWEDISSNALNAALNLRRVIRLAQEILAMESALAIQAMALRLEQGPSTRFGTNTTSRFQQVVRLCQNQGISLPVVADRKVGDFLQVIRKEICTPF